MANVLLAAPVHAQDTFIGTLHVEAEGLVLRRCDLGSNRYHLRDADPASATPTASYLANPDHRVGVWVAGVIGEYEEHGETHGLAVMSLEDVRQGASCHLMDALDAIDAGQ